MKICQKIQFSVFIQELKQVTKQGQTMYYIKLVCTSQTGVVIRGKSGQMIKKETDTIKIKHFAFEIF